MNFESQGQETCYAKVSGYMKELFGEYAKQHPERPAFGMAMGSAFVNVVIHPWSKEEATISVRSYVISGAELVPGLLEWLLRKNSSMRFGAFGLDTEGNIFFGHTIVGSTCDKKELQTSIMAVIQTADELDDEIKSQWGGKRADDE